MNYVDLASYLFAAKVVTEIPDLWIKRQSKNPIPDDIAQWKHRYGTRGIETDEIFVISPPGNDYIIIAVLEGGEVKPVAVGRRLLNFGMLVFILNFRSS